MQHSPLKQERMDKAVVFAAAAAHHFSVIQDKESVVNAVLQLKASVEEQLISYRPPMEPDKQIEAHAHWTFLHGQLALLEQQLNYLIPSDIESNQTDEAQQS